MKTTIFKFFLLLFAFAVYANSSFAQPEISFTISDYNGYGVSCFGIRDGSITVNVTGGTPPYTYEWSNGETTATINNLSASYYAVIVVDNTGEGVEAGINLTTPEPVQIELTTSEYPNGYSVSCFQCFNGSITSSVSGGVPPYAYHWEDGPTTQNRSSLGGNTGYTVQVTDDNDCATNSETSLSEPPRDDWTMQGNYGSNPASQYIGSADNTDFVFRTNATERIRIKNNGNVGIGTNNPLATLDVNGNAKFGDLNVTTVQVTSLALGNPCASIVVTDGTGNLELFNPEQCSSSPLVFWSTVGNTLPDNITQFIGTISNHDFRIKTSNVERMIVRADGKVGIGASAPSEKLQVGGGNLYIQGEGVGIVVDEGINKRTGLIKYFGHNAGLWRGWDGSTYVNFEIGRVNVTSLPGSPSTFTTDLYIDGSGKVGIGTTNTTEKLVVKGDVQLLNDNTNSGELNTLQIIRSNSANNFRVPTRRGITIDDDPSGNFNFWINSNQGPAAFNFNDGADPQNPQTYMTINKHGVVGIGTTTFPDISYKLYVTGGIKTEKVRVELCAGYWCDYVFEETYKLMSLTDLEKFIKEKKHLPEIPQAEEVAASGIDVAEMDAKLLKKIEELTLYVIELKKENDFIKQKLFSIESGR